MKIETEKKNPVFSERGFSLLEAVIALLILTVGLLGLASMQGQALRATDMGGNSAIAKSIAMDAMERIIRNSQNVRAYDGMSVANGTKPNCPNIAPLPACAIDFNDWQNMISSLPGGDLQISVNQGGNFDTVTVLVLWQDAMGTHTITVPLQIAP